MTPDLGSLDRRVRIEQRSTSQDAYGSPLDSWSTYATVWASVQEVLPSKGEAATHGIRIAERPARVRMRYVSGITAQMRLVYLDRSDRVMKIVSAPVELGRKNGLELMVSDFTSSGNAE